MLLGAETTVWFPENAKEEGDGYYALLVSLRYYPLKRFNLYLTGGIGGGTVEVTGDELEATGLAVQGGLGYDLRISRRFSLSPFVSYLQTFKQ